MYYKNKKIYILLMIIIMSNITTPLYSYIKLHVQLYIGDITKIKNIY